MSWLLVPDMEVSSSDLTSLRGDMLAPSAGWRETSLSQRVWDRECERGTFDPLLSTLIFEPSDRDLGVTRFISSLEDIRVSPSQSLGRCEAETILATSGRTYCECSPVALRHFSSWKTCEATPPKVLEKFSGNWPVSGSMQNGICSVLKRRELLINGRGSSYLPTTHSGIFFSNRGGQNSKDPRGWSRHGPLRLTLYGMARDGKWPDREVPPGRLSPKFTEWLMMWPIGLTGVEELGTESFQSWRLAHGVNSQEG